MRARAAGADRVRNAWQQQKRKYDDMSEFLQCARMQAKSFPEDEKTEKQQRRVKCCLSFFPNACREVHVQGRKGDQ